jgi:predicted DsbA family dithiol-disulfide isomerase
LAHKLASANAHITADVIEITEFPELAQRYQIFGVPKTVINDTVEFEGALPEEMFVQQALSAAQDGTQADDTDGFE